MDRNKTANEYNTSKIISGIILSLFSGVMLLFAFPAYGGIWILAPFAVIPMIVAQYRFFPRKLSGMAMWLTWLVYWVGLSYIGARQLQPLWIALLIGVALSLPGALLGSFDRIFNERTNFRYFLLTMPAVWTGWDFLLSWNPFNSSEGQIFYLMGPMPTLYQPISLFGSPALTFIMLVFGSTIALAFIRKMDKKHIPDDAVLVQPKAFKKVLIWGMGLVVVWVALSLFLYSKQRTGFGPTIRVAAIQIGTGTGFKDDGTGVFKPETKKVFENLSLAASADGAKMLIWPEEGLDFDPRKKDVEWIPSMARQTGAYIQASWANTDPDKTQHNMAGLWSPDGKLLGIYNKQNPVLPAGEIFNQEPVFEVFDTPLGRIGMIICFDITFYNISRIQASNGAQIISASVGDWLDVATSRIATAQFRAVENGVAYAKGELLSGSAMIDPTGVVIAKSDPPSGISESRYIIANLPLGQSRTLYSYTGNIFGFICVIGLFVRIFFQIRMRRKPNLKP